MVEAAWVTVEHQPNWKGEFERLSARIGKPKAIVAIARKLLVAVWHVLSRRCADIHADVQAVARTLLRWTARCGTTPGKRRSQALLLRHYLDQLGRGRRSGSNSLQWSCLSPQRTSCQDIGLEPSGSDRPAFHRGRRNGLL